MKILKKFEIMQALMDSKVCLETEWTNFLSNEQSLRNSIVNKHRQEKNTNKNYYSG